MVFYVLCFAGGALTSSIRKFMRAGDTMTRSDVVAWSCVAAVSAAALASCVTFVGSVAATVVIFETGLKMAVYVLLFPIHDTFREVRTCL